MLSSFIEKLNVVQDGISSSFKGLAVGQPLPREHPENTAGCDLLSRYQRCWQDLTNAAEYNANLAKDIDVTVTTLHNSVQKKKQIWSALSSELLCLDEVVLATESVVNSIGKLRMDISEIEEDLIRLENLIETEEFFRKQDHERMKLNLFREQKLENLDKYRASLSMRHNDKMKKKEEEESFVKQVKSEVLEQRVKQDLENYKAFGVLPEKAPSRTQSSLEEVVLDEDTDELAKYLQDS